MSDDEDVDDGVIILFLFVFVLLLLLLGKSDDETWKGNTSLSIRLLNARDEDKGLKKPLSS